jgi:predicted membrane-bound spermidine synthase
LPWTVALIEGFSTLAVEVIAIRLAIPIVGSSITLTGVMLGVVLLALSAGYWRGGMLSARWDKARARNALTRNLLIAAILYGAVAFPLEAATIEKALDLGLSLPLAIGTAASLLFLLPIYLASQTVPMLAELTNVEGKAGKASGQVLFFSTIGSVLGGIVTPVYLFPWLGVAHSTFVVCGLLACGACALAIGHPRALRTLGFGTAALTTVVAVNVFAARGQHGFSFDSAYQSIRIVDEETGSGRVARTLIMSGSHSSGVYADTGETSFAYVKAADKALAESRAGTVLVIGSAGFTFPRDAAALP